MVEANAYERRWFIISMGASPLFIATYLGLLPSWRALAGALGAGAALAGTAAAGTARLGGKAPVWSLGTGYPIGEGRVGGGARRHAARWGTGNANVRIHSTPPLSPPRRRAGRAVWVCGCGNVD